MFLGMAYHPEYWPSERWPIDAKLMREANIQVVRTGEFSWDRFEPSEGQFDFSWMDVAVNILANEGIKTIMCTPTAAPPSWLMHQHPEIQPIDANGLISRRTGRRRHYCCNVPAFQEATRRIVTAMAEHYGSNPNIVGWQIDNELADIYWLDKGRCYCESCRKGFIAWIKAKYDTLDALNKAWGTVFWSQEYTDWDQMVLPSRGTAGEGSSPSHVLDFYRFYSDSWAAYIKLQAGILRTRAQGQWVSTNFAGGTIREIVGTEDDALHRAAACAWFPCIVDWKKASQSLDFPAWSSHLPGMIAALCDDYLRGIREDGKFAVLEGGGNRLNCYQLFARGGMGVAPFTWRAPLFGAESGVD